MKLTKEIIVALLTKKYGRIPTDDEIWEEVTSHNVGLIMLAESLVKPCK